MTRSLSLAALQAAQAEETEQVYLYLLTLSHSDPAFETKRYVRNGADIVSRGEIFTGTAFDVHLPIEDDEELPELTVTWDNVDRRDVEAIRSLQGPPTVTLEVVLASSPDTVELGPIDMELRSARYDALTIGGTVGQDPLLHLPYPADTYNQADYPGIF